MFAILKDGIVIDCGFSNGEAVVTAQPPHERVYEEGYCFVQMTLENSPAQFGQKFNGKTFYFD